MTLKDVVRDTRPESRTDRELLEEWADMQTRILNLEHALDAIEAEIRERGWSI